MHIQNEYEPTVLSGMLATRLPYSHTEVHWCLFIFLGFTGDHTETISSSHRVIKARTKKPGCVASYQLVAPHTNSPLISHSSSVSPQYKGLHRSSELFFHVSNCFPSIFIQTHTGRVSMKDAEFQLSPSKKPIPAGTWGHHKYLSKAMGVFQLPFSWLTSKNQPVLLTASYGTHGCAACCPANVHLPSLHPLPFGTSPRAQQIFPSLRKTPQGCVTFFPPANNMLYTRSTML